MALMSPEQDRLRTGPGRWGLFFAAIWLLYLLAPLQAGWARRDSPAGWLGIAVTLVFAAVYLAVFIRLRRRRDPGQPFRVPLPVPARWTVVGSMVALGVLDCVALGQTGTATAVYIAVVAMISLPSRPGWAVAGTVALGAYGATLVLPGWHEDRGILFGTLVAALAIWGVTQAVNRSTEVLLVREENARLALSEERNRFARDLHDILGHSLTVITVKAELANRLLVVDPVRAREELADLERLSRDALADVRRAVEGYRELTLPGELARARSALAAAEIEADLPGSADDVPSDRRELFAWTVREGVTNVIRHSSAGRCCVRLAPTEVEVRDDGVGPTSGLAGGHGLVGLRERAAALGARVVTEALQPGFSLRVVVE
ncbi:MAG TPA: histidine kinase [Marmoricola sp.]|nr:histidine kinase [Marmoricola sp.]